MNDIWETPIDLFKKLDKIHKFETDVCALAENTKCKKYYTPEFDNRIQK